MFGKKYKKFISIEGMSCERCANKISSSLSHLKDVLKVKVLVNEKGATLVSKVPISDEEITRTIEELGYKVNYIKDL